MVGGGESACTYIHELHELLLSGHQRSRKNVIARIAWIIRKSLVRKQLPNPLKESIVLCAQTSGCLIKNPGKNRPRKPNLFYFSLPEPSAESCLGRSRDIQKSDHVTKYEQEITLTLPDPKPSNIYRFLWGRLHKYYKLQVWSAFILPLYCAARLERHGLCRQSRTLVASKWVAPL